MITPKFSCEQNEKSLILRIYVPAVRASDISMHVEDTLFSLHINPYYLRLTLPGAVIEDDDSSAVYDPATGYLCVTLTKKLPREHFNDLDILAKLLAPPKRDDTPFNPLVEVIDAKESETDPGGVAELDDLGEAEAEERLLADAAQNDWHHPQTVQGEISLSKARYGFLDAYSGYFTHVAMTENEVNELGPEVERLATNERREKRISHENNKWDDKYYLADFVDNESIKEILRYEFSKDSPLTCIANAPLEFDEEEKLEMLSLPRKEYLPTSGQTHNLYLTLITILFSYAYDARTTQADPTPESAWTICSLTPAFSALDPPPYTARGSSLDLKTFTPEEIQEALVPSLRRSLAFPLYRSFALSQKCVQDASNCFKKGKKAVLRALMQTKKILDGHEVYYIYSKIWLDDFCRWIASGASDGILQDLGKQLSAIVMDKRCVGWDLEALETSTLGRVHERSGPDSDDDSQPDDSRRVSDNEDDGSSVEFSSLPSSPLSSTSTLSSSSMTSSSSSESASARDNAVQSE